MSKLKNIFKFICAIALLVSIQLQAKLIDISPMAGWHDCFQEDKKYLSPFNGFIWWETKFIERMFRFGNVQTKQILRANGGVWTQAVNGDATIQLLYELFQDIEGSLHLVTEKTHCAAYLTSERIGKILNFTENIHDSVLKVVQQRKDLRKSYASEIQNIEGLLRQVKGANDQVKLQTMLANRPDFYIELIKTCLELQLKMWFKTDLDKQKAATRKEIYGTTKIFVDLFVQALQEAGHLLGKEQRYLPHTPHMILLAFMYAQVDNAAEFKIYVTQFDNQVAKDTWLEILQNKKFDNAWTSEGLSQEFGSVNEQNQRDEFIRERFEEICFTGINEQFYKLQTPLLLENNYDVTIAGRAFASCAEEALCNFTKFILSRIGAYNHIDRAFELDKIEEKMKARLDSKGYKYDVQKLHAKLADLRKVFESFNDQVSMVGQDFSQAWAQFVSDREGIRYNCCIAADGSGKELDEINRVSPFIYQRAGQDLGDPQLYRAKVRDGSCILCQLAGSPSMYVDLTNDILGLDCSDFAQICSLFDISIKNREVLPNFTDHYVYDAFLNNKPGVALNLETVINQQLVAAKVVATAGHAAVVPEVIQKNNPSSLIANYVSNNFMNNCLCTQLMLVYSSYHNVKNYNMCCIQNSIFHNYLWLAKPESTHNQSLAQLALVSNQTFLHDVAELQFSKFVQR